MHSPIVDSFEKNEAKLSQYRYWDEMRWDVFDVLDIVLGSEPC